jgi:ribose-phosphate pyrophosphokinase
MSKVVLQELPPVGGDGAAIAARLGIARHDIAVHPFPDGELRVTVGPVAPVTIIHGSLDRPNDKLVALLLACEALRRGGCQRIVLVAPYLCYMRQDAAFNAGEAISQRAVGRLLAELCDRVITVDAHLHRTPTIGEVFPGITAQNLSAMPAIADALAARLDRTSVVVGPDAESLPWVRDLAGRLGLDHAVAHKLRHGDHAVTVAFPDPARLRGRPILLVDDIVSSGGTLIACARALKAANVTSIDAVVTHALFPDGLRDAFTTAGIRSIRSTTSVTHSTNAISLAGLLAEALRGEIDAATSEPKP